jgi:hypothetical protein
MILIKNVVVLLRSLPLALRLHFLKADLRFIHV